MSEKHQYPNRRGVKNENLDSLEAGPSLHQYPNRRGVKNENLDSLEAGPSLHQYPNRRGVKNENLDSLEAGPSFIEDDECTRTIIKEVINKVYKKKTEIKIKRVKLENIFIETFEQLQLIKELALYADLDSDLDSDLDLNESLVCSSFLANPLQQSLASYRSLPKYPQSRSYPPNVSKPPALVIMAMEGKDVMMLKLCKFKDNQKPENIVKLDVFLYKEGVTDKEGFQSLWWEKVCEVKTNALSLPRTYSFNCKILLDKKYNFMVRAVDAHNRKGDFSNSVAVIFTRSSQIKNTRF